MNHFTLHFPKAQKLAVILLLFSCTAFGQSGKIVTKITGKDGDALTGSIAELRIVKDSSLVKTAVADAAGAVVLENVKAGSYFLKASFIGYTAYRSSAIEFNGS